MEFNSSNAAAEAAGAEGQEFAAPEASGEEVREVADPGAAGTTEEGRQQQSAEERHRFAEQRRAAERESYRAQLRQEIEAENSRKMDAVIASMGKINPFTRKAITSYAEMEEYNTEKERREREAELSRMGISRKTLDALIDEHPAVKAAREMTSRLEEQKKAFEQAQLDGEVRNAFAEIQKIDPNIKSPRDLMNHPRYAEIKRLVRENDHTIGEAFRIATEEDRNRQQNERVRQAAAMTAAGKSHLSAMTAAGATAPQVTVPDAIMRNYLKQNPKMTPAQAKEKYARFLNLTRTK